MHKKNRFKLLLQFLFVFIVILFFYFLTSKLGLINKLTSKNTTVVSHVKDYDTPINHDAYTTIPNKRNVSSPEVKAYLLFTCPSCILKGVKLIEWAEKNQINLDVSPIDFGSDIVKNQCIGFFIAQKYNKASEYLNAMYEFLFDEKQQVAKFVSEDDNDVQQKHEENQQENSKDFITRKDVEKILISLDIKQKIIDKEFLNKKYNDILVKNLLDLIGDKIMMFPAVVVNGIFLVHPGGFNDENVLHNLIEELYYASFTTQSKSSTSTSSIQ